MLTCAIYVLFTTTLRPAHDIGTAAVNMGAGSASPFLRWAPARVAVGRGRLCGSRWAAPTPWRDLPRALHWCQGRQHEGHVASRLPAPTLAVQPAHTHTPRCHAWTMPARSATQCQPVQSSACLCACRAEETTVDGVSARLGSGRVRLPRGGVGRGPGRANDAQSQLRIGSSTQPRPRAAGNSRGCDEPRPPIGHAKRSVVARVRGRAGSSPARVPLRGWGASRQVARNKFGGRLACLEVPSWVMPRA